MADGRQFGGPENIQYATDRQVGYDAPLQPDFLRGAPVATPNYSFEKRQRELAKKRKKEEKNQRKLTNSSVQDTETSESPADELTSAGEDAPRSPETKT